MEKDVLMDSRSDNDIVIEYTVRLERLLKESYGATGTGLGTLLTSVSNMVPETVVKEGRRLAAMRNKVVHEHVPLENRSEFIRRCERLEDRLRRGVHVGQQAPRDDVIDASHLRPPSTGVMPLLDRTGRHLERWMVPLLVGTFAWAAMQAGLVLYGVKDADVFWDRLVDTYAGGILGAAYLVTLVLFFKNARALISRIGFLPGGIVAAGVAAVLAIPQILTFLISPSFLGGMLAGYLQVLSPVSDLMSSHFWQVQRGVLTDDAEEFVRLQRIDAYMEAARFLAYSGLGVLLLIAGLYYRLAKVYSGHLAAALLVYVAFFGISEVNPSIVMALPLLMLAIIDLAGIIRTGRINVMPTDIMKRVVGSPARRRQGATHEGQDGAEATSSPFRAEKPRYNFSHVVGMSDLKARLSEAGREIVNARRRGVAARNGILLYGPPGTGKTFFAEALAGELGLKIIKANFGQTASRWVNQTTEQVMAVFREAEQQAPVVLFMDEIDTILIDRSKVSNADSEAARLVSAFLPAIERLRVRGVVVIGATNLLDQLDPAAIREGRFDFKIEVPYPDEEARFAILKERVIKTGLTTQAETLKRLARRWSGFSVARMQAIVDEAARMGIDGPADFDGFMAALRKVQGRKGARGEGGPTLEQLTLSPRMQESLEDIAGRMKNIEAIERLGGALPRGILFYGPPGTGKTFTARALANSADWAFLTTTGHDLLANPKKIDEIMSEASDLRPVVVFIDEADDVFGHRGFSNAASITNKLLTAMDGANGRVPDVVFIAATNHPDNFDPAALRGGRFTEKVEFELPGLEALRDHIQKWIDAVRATIEPAVRAEDIAELVLGHPLATVNEVLQAAVNRMASKAAARGEGGASIGMDDIREGFRRVAGGDVL